MIRILSRILALMLLYSFATHQSQAYFRSLGAEPVNTDVRDISRITVGVNSVYEMHARYYSSDLKRFATADPLGVEGGLNLYVYGSDNPLAFLDPLGLCGGQSWGQGFPSDVYINPIDLNQYDPFGGYHVPVASSAFRAGQDIANGQYVSAGFNLGQSAAEAWIVRDLLASMAKSMVNRFAADATGQDLLSIWNSIGVPGKKRNVRLVENADEAIQAFDDLSRARGAIPMDPPPVGYDGPMVQLSDGSRVGIRASSKSGGPAVDVHVGTTFNRIHVNAWQQ